MSTRKNSYTAITAPTWTLASLATSSTLGTGRESAAVDNSSTFYIDVQIRVEAETGTSPTAGTIELWIVPSFDGSTYPDVFAGADAGRTVTSRDILFGSARLGASIPTDATSNRKYELAVPSLRDLFGTVPQKFSLFLTHNTAVNLNSTGGNFSTIVEGILETIA